MQETFSDAFMNLELLAFERTDSGIVLGDEVVLAELDGEA